MEIKYKDINQLTQKSQIDGDEKLPVSKDEYITPSQIASLGGAAVRYNTTSYWNSQIGFIPRAGEVIVYSDYRQIEEDGVIKQIPGFKVGTGNAYVQDLVFSDQGSDNARFEAHMANTDIHITEAERLFWGAKLNVDDAHEVEDEELIFIRN